MVGKGASWLSGRRGRVARIRIDTHRAGRPRAACPSATTLGELDLTDEFRDPLASLTGEGSFRDPVESKQLAASVSTDWERRKKGARCTPGLLM
jgi:hypothetical protein